jgi:glutamate racemase
MGIVGVIAGTPVDTRMGVELISKKGMVAIGRYSSATPEEQTRMQTLTPLELTEQTIGLANELIGEGADRILIYCNSLSGAIDLPLFRKAVGVPVVTPLDVYRELAGKYKRVAVLAANCQSLAAIERTFQQENPGCLVFGAGLLPVVIAIEQSISPGEIVNRYGLKKIIEGLADIGVDALILGCTHFPYIALEVKKICPVELVEPGEKMAELLGGDVS